MPTITIKCDDCSVCTLGREVTFVRLPLPLYGCVEKSNKAEKVSKNIEISAATDVLYLLQTKPNLQNETTNSKKQDGIMKLSGIFRQT